MEASLKVTWTRASARKRRLRRRRWNPRRCFQWMSSLRHWVSVVAVRRSPCSHRHRPQKLSVTAVSSIHSTTASPHPLSEVVEDPCVLACRRGVGDGPSVYVFAGLGATIIFSAHRHPDRLCRGRDVVGPGYSRNFRVASPHPRHDVLSSSSSHLDYGDDDSSSSGPPASPVDLLCHSPLCHSPPGSSAGVATSGVAHERRRTSQQPVRPLWMESRFWWQPVESTGSFFSARCDECRDRGRQTLVTTQKGPDPIVRNAVVLRTHCEQKSRCVGPFSHGDNKWADTLLSLNPH